MNFVCSHIIPVLHIYDFFNDFIQNSVNARYQTIPYPWLVFGEKVKVNAVFIRDSTGVSDSILILFGGALSNGIQVISLVNKYFSSIRNIRIQIFQCNNLPLFFPP
jgi:hypothetical protein